MFDVNTAPRGMPNSSAVQSKVVRYISQLFLHRFHIQRVLVPDALFFNLSQTSPTSEVSPKRAVLNTPDV